MIKVRLFAAYREAVGAEEIVLDAEPGLTVGDLWDRLRAEHPVLDRWRASAAVNATWAREDTVLVDGDEVAFLPPVSGG
jgi:molybdopterin synthase sulfur carrier subunit